MRLTRRIVTIAASVMCALALAACGKQVVAHVTASDSVHSALTSVFTSPTTQYVVTVQGLPGQAASAEGSFSVVITTSHDQGTSTSSPMTNQSIDLSVDYRSNALVDLRAVDGSAYFRVDLKNIEGLAGGPAGFAAESKTLDQLAARPGFGFIHDALLGDWIGVSTSTLTSVIRQLEPQMAGGLSSISGIQSSISSIQSSISGIQKASGLGQQVTSSWLQSVRTWLSVHKTKSNEYSLTLPVRSFAGSLLQAVAKPLATYANEPILSHAQLLKAIDRIPASLSMHANLWVSNGSATKLQLLIPNSTGSILIAVSHPASPVQVPSNPTMLSTGDLTSIFGSVSGPVVKALGSSRASALSAL